MTQLSCIEKQHLDSSKADSQERPSEVKGDAVEEPTFPAQDGSMPIGQRPYIYVHQQRLVPREISNNIRMREIGRAD
jgi:hypothetical protein